MGAAKSRPRSSSKTFDSFSRGGRSLFGEFGAREGCKGLRYHGKVGHEAAIYTAHTEETLHLDLGLRIPEAPSAPGDSSPGHVFFPV